MLHNKPRLNIGLPVFNGEKYLEQALDSILNQTYRDFELIISDNASNDKTQQICREYARMDNRVKYYRNKVNLGAPANYNRVFRLSSSEYFKWISHDDIHAPDYLQKCIQILDNNPAIVLCHSKTGRIDENGKLVGNYDNMSLSRIGSEKSWERFGDLISPRNHCWYFFGVIRSNLLKKTPLHGDYILADRNLLAELGLMGQLYEIPEHLFLRRDHSGAYTNVYYSKPVIVRDYRVQSEWWTGKKGSKMIMLPHWKNCLEFVRSVHRVPLGWTDRLFCYREIYKWLTKDKGLSLMKWDMSNVIQLWRLSLNHKPTLEAVS